VRVADKNGCRINMIWVVQSGIKKYFAFPFPQISGISPAIPALSRGAFRDRHERWARDAMDAGARVTNARSADGEAVWS
jgi:hypothetical protein